MLHGLVLAATGDVDEAIDELTRELEYRHSSHVYARECVSNTWYALGALRHRQGRREEACAAFNEALTMVRGHVGATAALGIDPLSAPRRADSGTIHLAMAQAIGLARAGRHRDAVDACTDALTQAPPGPAGWLLPVDPMLPENPVLLKLNDRGAFHRVFRAAHPPPVAPADVRRMSGRVLDART